MNTGKIGKRGQITLPSEIRKQTGLQEGDRIAFVAQGDQIILRPLTKTLLELRGSVAVSEKQDFSAVRKQVISSQVEKRVLKNG